AETWRRRSGRGPRNAPRAARCCTYASGCGWRSSDRTSGTSTTAASRRRLRFEAMAKIGVMIEGQEGLNWERWRHICHDADTLGFDALRRSEHFISVFGVVERDCIECWTSLALAAEWTKRIQIAPMVSPIMF